MYDVFELYKMLPVCCSGMKKHNILITKYNVFFSYIIVDDSIDDYSAKKLYDKYIEFIDNNTICKTLVEKLCDVEITVSYDIILNTFVRKDRLCWSENTYDKIVSEYCNVELIKHTIIPCYDCRMGEKCGYSCEI